MTMANSTRNSPTAASSSPPAAVNNDDTPTPTSCGGKIPSPFASCTEAACQSIQHIIPPGTNDLACLHPSQYFKLHTNNNNHRHIDEYVDDTDVNDRRGGGSPVMYSNTHAHTLTGLTKCEYCGNSNIATCEGVSEVHEQLDDYQRRLFGASYFDGVDYSATAVEEQRNDMEDFHNHFVALQHQINHDNNIIHNKTQQQQSPSSAAYHYYLGNNNNENFKSISSQQQQQQPRSPNNNATTIQCHRPKLFFLKKRPPFANTQTGWNTQTQYRNQLFEPPSSMEGVGRGYGEVRGRLGDYCTVNYNHNNTNSYSGHHLKNHDPYQIHQRSLSLPVGVGVGMNNNSNSVCGEGTEISFATARSSSVGANNNNNGATAAGGGRRSPILLTMTNSNNNVAIGNNNNNNNINGGGGSDAGSTARSLSPLQWVNGSEIKGVMKWFG